MEWPIRESVVQDYGSPGLEQWRVRIGSSGEGSNRRYGTAVNFEGLGKVRHLAVGDLWVQHHVRSGKFRVPKMSGLENPSDAQTKYLGPEPLLHHTNTCTWVPVVDDGKL